MRSDQDLKRDRNKRRAVLTFFGTAIAVGGCMFVFKLFTFLATIQRDEIAGSQSAQRILEEIEDTGQRAAELAGQVLAYAGGEDAPMAALDLDRTTARAELGIDDERFVVLAFGGSLGARRINHAVLDLAEEWRDRDDVAIRHVIGRRDWPDLTERVAALADEPLAYEAVEFEDRLPTALVAADVAVCRAGGMTIAELTALGVPAVLVPLPIAPNDAQRANAAAMSAAGAAVVVDDEALDHHLLAEHHGHLGFVIELWRFEIDPVDTFRCIGNKKIGQRFCRLRREETRMGKRKLIKLCFDRGRYFSVAMTKA